MTCAKCGMPAQGRYCKTCERAERQESYYGVPSDDTPDVRDWDDDDEEEVGENE